MPYLAARISRAFSSDENCWSRNRRLTTGSLSRHKNGQMREVIGMDKQPGLILYLEDMAALEMLPDIQFKTFVCGLYHYALEGSAPAFDDVGLDALFVLFRAKIDRNAAKYSRQVAQRREASAQRWKSDRMRPHPTVSECIQTKTETVTETKRKTQSSLSPPSLSDVQAEAERAGLHMDAAQFLADMETDGWKDGKGELVRDWRKYLRGYAALKHAGAKAPPPAPSYGQRSYCPEELAARTDADFEAAVTALEGGDES